MAQDTGWSRTGISSAMTFAFLSMPVTAMLWGALSDRFGALYITCCLLGLGAFLTAMTFHPFPKTALEPAPPSAA